VNLEAAAKAVSQARQLLALHEPFFGIQACHLRPTVVVDGSVPTSAVDPEDRLLYCPEYVLGLTARQRGGLVAHEVLHVVLDVFGRRGDRDMKLWNVAHDYVINLIIVSDCKWAELPPGGLLDQRFSGLTAEQVYDILVQEQKGQPEPQDGEGQPGSGHGTPGGCCDHRKAQANPGQTETQRVIWQARTVAAAAAVRGQGRCPGSIEDLVQGIVRPKADVWNILRRFIEQGCEAGQDTTYTRPGRRSSVLGRITPGPIPDPAVVVIAVDTSGSVCGEILERFLGRVAGILRGYKGAQVRVLAVDDGIRGDITTADVEDVRASLKGGGGTDFEEVFEELSGGESPAALVFLTDLYASGIPDRAPGYPVLWAVPADGHGDAPWGRVIEIEIEGEE
jgi:predicted metal-dependent peptidase